MKYAGLYSDLLQALKERTFDSSRFSEEGTLISVSVLPYHGYSADYTNYKPHKTLRQTVSTKLIHKAISSAHLASV